MTSSPRSPLGPVFDIRVHGAVGDGLALDTAAINRAIDAAAAAGGGTVLFPAGTYLSFSIRLKSHVTLQFAAGATLVAAEPGVHAGAYDEAEPNEPWDQYQDFGHSHWQNSLIWGIDLEHVAIIGPGLINGAGLTKRGPGPRRPEKPGDTPLSLGDSDRAAAAALAAEDLAAGRKRPDDDMTGQGNKAIALKNCRHVILRDFSILRGGHFAILPTGVDHFTLENLRVDTNRDGINLDCCRHVHMTGCWVNTPNDDGIVLKSSYGLGELRATEDVVIAHCKVSGFDLGTMLDGTLRRTQGAAPDRDGVTGRIKFGTESNGGFKRIHICDCAFERSRGLAIEVVDGGVIEDITVERVTMHEITTAPLFIRIGNRARGPDNPPVGIVRRVIFSDITVTDADPRFASLFCGLPGHPIEEVLLSRVKIVYRGGGTAEDAAREPAENEKAYPEPSMFGVIPAYGLFARHVKHLTVRDVEVGFATPELRPAIRLDHAETVRLERVVAPTAPGVPVLVARAVNDLAVRACPGLADTI